MRSGWIFLWVVFLFQASLQAQPPDRIAERAARHWLALHNQFRDTADVWGKYTLDLTLEALLFYDHYTGQDRYAKIVAEVFNQRKVGPVDTINFRTQPFCSINFTLGSLTGDPEWFGGFMAESYRMYREAFKSPEGAIMLNHQGRHRVLIDYMQEYTSRLAKTGYLTEDTLLFSESVSQYLIYEDLLRDTSNGLWSQGRGFCPDTTRFAGGAWSRGHGWLLRGLVTTMLHLPRERRMTLLPVLERVAHALLAVQAESGMFHILLHLPVDASAPDVSGTGMIAYYLSIAVERGWLEEGIFQPAILKATRAIKSYVTDAGEVLSSCKGPGPLCTVDDYLGYTPEIDESHGFQGVIYGMMAGMMMEE